MIRVFPWAERKRKLLAETGKPYYSVLGFQPYFYIENDQLDPIGAVRVERGFASLDGPLVKKVIVTVPAEVPILRKTYEPHYEADVLFPQRYIIDRIPELPHSEPDLLYLDIEMAASRGLPDPLNPVDPITCISTYNSAFKTFHTFGWHARHEYKMESRNNVEEVFRTEADMLRAFARYVGQTYPDAWVGWNLINFDVRCLIGRFVHCGVRPGLLSPLNATFITRHGEPVIKGVVLFDLLAAYKAFKNRDFDSLSLEATAQRELGEGKRPIDKSKIAVIWAQNPREVFAYCRTDVELIVRIDRKLRLLEYWNELHEGTGVQLGDLIDWQRKKLHGAHIVETYIMRNSKLVLRSHVHGGPEWQLRGAEPRAPERGMHKNIINLDVSSLYPSIISTFNLSPDTLRSIEGENFPDALHLDECWTYKHKEKLGELPRLISMLFEEKDKYHALRNQQVPGSDEYALYDRRRYVSKQILNAFQGASSQPSSRIFNKSIAHDITWAGRELMNLSERKMVDLGYQMIGGHTDSVFFKVKTEDLDRQVAVGTQVADELTKSFKKWAVERGVAPRDVRLVSELAGVASAGFFHAKTMYALKMTWKGDQATGKTDDEYVVAGFQSQRSDYPTELRELMDTFLRRILDGVTPESAAEPVMERLRLIHRGEVPASRVAIPKGLHKQMDDYNNGSPWASGASWSNKHLTTVRFGAGSKPKLLYVKKVPRGMDETRAICIESDTDLIPGIEVDWPLMADKIRNGFRGIVTALGLQPKTFLTPQSSLEMWV